MGLPNTPNSTCDIYRTSNAPPAAPDVSGVLIYLTPDFARAHAAAVAAGTLVRWTHVALMDVSTDIRDDYAGNVGGITSPTLFDLVWVPDKNGTRFQVVFVERVGYGTANDHLRVYLVRTVPTWPTSYL